STVVVPRGMVEPDAGSHPEAVTVSSGSLNVTEYVTVAPAELVASTSKSAGGMITGGRSSAGTLTGKGAQPGLPGASVAVHVTSVVPSGNKDPDAGMQLTGTGPSTMSLAVGLEYVTTSPVGGPLPRTMSAGTPARAGGVVSTTFTANDACALFPWVSVAVH